MRHSTERAWRSTPLRLAALIAVGLVLVLIAPAGADAQCAMCKSAVQGAGEQATRAMNSGILVLLIPPVAIFCSIFAVFIKYKNGDERADTEKHDAR
ncbi:MAG TPA: hypothetical protein VF240_16850 [Pyrinomonadaceae bacterium]